MNTDVTKPTTVAQRPTKMAICEKHETHGEYESTNLFGKFWSRCPICTADNDAKNQAEEKAKLEAVEKRRQEQRIQTLIQYSNIPPRFLDRTLERFIADTPEKKRALTFAKEYAEGFQSVYNEGQCALFTGRPGTGKTHLASGIGLYLMNQGYSVLYTTVSRLIRRIRSTWNRASEETEDQAIAAFASPSLLILDEVGVQYGSEAEKIPLFDVLNERYECLMSTLFISNLTKDGVAESLGERVYDRLRENSGRIIAFSWESQRPKMAMRPSKEKAGASTLTAQEKSIGGASDARAGG